MGKPPRQREKEARQRQQVAREQAARRHQRRQRLYAALALVALVGLVLSVVAVAATSGNKTASPTSTSLPVPSSPPSSTGPTVVPVEVAAPPPGETITGETPCPAADGSSPRVTSFENPPPNCIDTTKKYKAIIHTTEGDITALLNTDQAPETVNNFVVLSRYHFYDDVPFHTVVPRMMLVTGDATGDPIGSGGPGYSIPAEIPDVGVIYYWGALGMWNPNGERTSGSQFFIGAGENVTALPPDYTVFGLVMDGADPVNAIQKNANEDGTVGADMRITGIDIVEEDATG